MERSVSLTLTNTAVFSLPSAVKSMLSPSIIRCISGKSKAFSLTLQLIWMDMSVLPAATRNLLYCLSAKLFRSLRSTSSKMRSSGDFGFGLFSSTFRATISFVTFSSVCSSYGRHSRR